MTGRRDQLLAESVLRSSGICRAQASALVYSMVEMAKANGVNVYLTYLLEKMPSDRMSDEELELLAPWNENVKTEIQHRVNNTDQSDVNCQGAPATEK